MVTIERRPNLPDYLSTLRSSPALRYTQSCVAPCARVPPFHVPSAFPLHGGPKLLVGLTLPDHYRAETCGGNKLIWSSYYTTTTPDTYYCMFCHPSGFLLLFFLHFLKPRVHTSFSYIRIISSLAFSSRFNLANPFETVFYGPRCFSSRLSFNRLCVR